MVGERKLEADKFGRSSRGLLELNFWPPVANLGIGGHLGSVAGDALTNITSQVKFQHWIQCRFMFFESKGVYILKKASMLNEVSI